jgi:mono/diheme cytochrome c family protein
MKRNQLNIGVAVSMIAILWTLGACGGGDGSSAGVSQIDGKAVYTKYCVLCHGTDGRQETNGAKDLTLSVMSLNERVALLKTGKNLMTPFEGILSPAEMEAVSKYTMTLK